MFRHPRAATATSFLLLFVLLIPGVLAPTTSDHAPNTETLNRGTSNGIGNLLSDDGATNTITEGGASGSATDDYWASSSTIALGTLVSGTAPTAGDANDCGDASDNAYCNYQEANVGGAADTTLDPDGDVVTTGTKGGTFPTDLTSDNAAYVTITEANTGGAGDGSAPTFVDVDLISSSTGADVTVDLPTGMAANDIILVFGWVRDKDDSVTMTDYTAISGFPQETTTGRYWTFWKRHDGSEADPVFDKSTATGDTFVFAIAYRGALLSGDPWEVVGTWGSTGTNPLSLTGITTLTANALVVVPAGYEDNDLAACTTTGTDPATYVEHYVEATTGNDGAICISEQARTNAGGTGTVSVSWGTLSDQTGGILLSLKPEPAANYQMEYRVDWTDGSSSCSDGSRVLRVSAHRSSTEDVLVQVDDGDESFSAEGNAITITATSDPSPTYQTYTMSGPEWDLGLPLIRLIGATESGDTVQSVLSIDDLEILCDRPPPEYTASIKWSWSGVPTTGTEWRLFVEGKRVTSAETIKTCLWSANELSCTDIAACRIDTDSDATDDCGTLTADQLDTGAPDINFDDLTPTDTAQSTFDVDLVRIQRTFTTTTYDADVEHTWTSVALADAYELRVRASRSGTENWIADVRDSQDADYNLAKITVSSGVETLYTYSLAVACTGAADDCERDPSTGQVRIRWRTASSTDTVQDTLTLDQEIVQRTDNDPTISSRTNTPASGTSLTAFDFAMVYTDLVTCPASSADVSFNGGGAWSALTQTTPADTNCADGKAYDLQPDLAGHCPGTRTYRFRVSDGVNPTVTDSSDQTFTVTNLAPSVTPDLTSESVDEGTPYSNTFAHGDNDITIGCQSATWTTQPPTPAECTVTSPGGILTCTGALAAGVHSITVRVSDGTATADETFTLTVTAVDPGGGGGDEGPGPGFGLGEILALECGAFGGYVTCTIAPKVELFPVGIETVRWWVDGHEVVGTRVGETWILHAWSLSPTVARVVVQVFFSNGVDRPLMAREVPTQIAPTVLLVLLGGVAAVLAFGSKRRSST
jgi:hypothetical protein